MLLLLKPVYQLNHPEYYYFSWKNIFYRTRAPRKYLMWFWTHYHWLYIASVYIHSDCTILECSVIRILLASGRTSLQLSDITTTEAYRYGSALRSLKLENRLCSLMSSTQLAGYNLKNAMLPWGTHPATSWPWFIMATMPRILRVVMCSPSFSC